MRTEQARGFPLLACTLCLSLVLAACAGRSPELSAAPANRPEPAATASPLSPPQASTELDEYAAPEIPLIADPFETWNRFWFGFNDVLYLYVLRPVYKVYAFVAPQEIRNGLKNALTNALFPVRFLNSILQGKFLAAGVEFGRFIVNSTLGGWGLINITKDKKTIVEVDPDGADFGQTLGVWGTGPGVYFVWPVLGPSNLRDTVGRAGDWLADPLLFIPGSFTVSTVTGGIWAGLRFNAAGDILDTYENIKNAAVDPYLSMRDMYTRYRQGRIDRAKTGFQMPDTMPRAE